MQVVLDNGCNKVFDVHYVIKKLLVILVIKLLVILIQQAMIIQLVILVQTVMISKIVESMLDDMICTRQIFKYHI